MRLWLILGDSYPVLLDCLIHLWILGGGWRVKGPRVPVTVTLFMHRIRAMWEHLSFRVETRVPGGPRCLLDKP